MIVYGLFQVGWLWLSASHCNRPFTVQCCFQMKMPGSVGTKKAKAVEQLLEELGVGECIASF